MKWTLPITFAIVLLAGCDSSAEPPPESGPMAAAACLRDSGATRIEQNEGPHYKGFSSVGPDGNVVFAVASDADTSILAARKLRGGKGHSVTWLTPDHRAVAVTNGAATTREWRLAMKCALVLPPKPGKGNLEIQLDDFYVRREWNAGLVDGLCNLRPGRASWVVAGYVLQRDIGVRRQDGFMYRISSNAADRVLNARTRSATCQAFREWRFT